MLSAWLTFRHVCLDRNLISFGYINYEAILTRNEAMKTLQNKQHKSRFWIVKSRVWANVTCVKSTTHLLKSRCVNYHAPADFLMARPIVETLKWPLALWLVTDIFYILNIPWHLTSISQHKSWQFTHDLMINIYSVVPLVWGRPPLWIASNVNHGECYVLKKRFIFFAHRHKIIMSACIRKHLLLWK